MATEHNPESEADLDALSFFVTFAITLLIAQAVVIPLLLLFILWRVW